MNIATRAIPDKVMSINAHAINNLANASKSIDAVFIQISTDYVFDGLKNKPYQTSDLTNPINVYGYSKDEGEKIELRTQIRPIKL